MFRQDFLNVLNRLLYDMHSTAKRHIISLHIVIKIVVAGFIVKDNIPIKSTDHY